MIARVAIFEITTSSVCLMHFGSGTTGPSISAGNRRTFPCTRRFRSAFARLRGAISISGDVKVAQEDRNCCLIGVMREELINGGFIGNNLETRNSHRRLNSVLTAAKKCEEIRGAQKRKRREGAESPRKASKTIPTSRSASRK